MLYFSLLFRKFLLFNILTRSRLELTKFFTSLYVNDRYMKNKKSKLDLKKDKHCAK
jgi:hypothetical protein